MGGRAATTGHVLGERAEGLLRVAREVRAVARAPRAGAEAGKTFSHARHERLGNCCMSNSVSELFTKLSKYLNC